MTKIYLVDTTSLKLFDIRMLAYLPSLAVLVFNVYDEHFHMLGTATIDDARLLVTVNFTSMPLEPNYLEALPLKMGGYDYLQAFMLKIYAI
jgi:hypothetical protein